MTFKYSVIQTDGYWFVCRIHPGDKFSRLRKFTTEAAADEDLKATRAMIVRQKQDARAARSRAITQAFRTTP